MHQKLVYRHYRRRIHTGFNSIAHGALPGFRGLCSGNKSIKVIVGTGPHPIEPGHGTATTTDID